MSQNVDELLQQTAAADPAALERSRGALLAELRKPRPRAWTTDVLVLLASSWVLAGAIAVVVLALGRSSSELVLRHGAAVAMLAAVGAIAAWAALAPPNGARLAVALVAALGGLAALVAFRALGVTAMGAQPEWLCTVSHLGIGVAPLLVALAMLRKSSSHGLRAWLAGVAVGTSGALVGEVACEKPWQHVLVFHLSAWLAMAVLALLASRMLKRSSFAP